MNRRFLPTLLFALLLAACSKDENSPTENTGRLHGGRIQGVQWQTPTRSGVTDANGTFNYLPGEVVTFSIGKVELGSAPGAAEITLFTLAGLTPPTTERGLRWQLDLAMRKSTPFTRAVNLDLLLIALDADGDPANGIDARNRAASMARTTLDFGRPLADFNATLYEQIPSLNQYLPTSTVVAHLFSSMGLRIRVHATTRISSVSDDGWPPSVQTFTYDAAGGLRTQDGDGDGDGVVDSHVAYDYDAMGRVTRSEFAYDYLRDHVFDDQYVTESRFDAHGKVVSSTTSSRPYGAAVPEVTRLVERLEDEYGRPFRQITDIDQGGDGSVDSRELVTAEYDASGLRQAYTSTRDDGLDGVIDWRVRTVVTEDARHRPLSRINEIDSDANGVVDSRYTYTFSYDDVARTMRTVSEEDPDGDGIVDWRGFIEQQLDAAGNAVRETRSFDPLGAGNFQETTTLMREFDADRRVTRSTVEQDRGNDGTVDLRQIDTASFDELGNPLLMTSDYDFDVIGDVDQHQEQHFTHGADGESLGSVSRYGLNGLVGGVRRDTTVENVVVDDGVRLLTDYYLRTLYSGIQ